MKASIKKFKSSALIQSCLITGLCLVVYWLGPISTWETNDDVYYSLLFSGQLLTSAPEAHAVMVNFVLSSFFTQLYTFAPNIPWYGYFHVTALLLSVWFLNYCYALTRDNDNIWARTAITVVGVLPFLFYLQFTKTAAVLAVAGYLGLYLLNQTNPPSPRKNLLLHITAIALLLFSFTLRRDSFLLITLLCSLLLLSALLKKKRPLFVSLATMFILISVVTFVHMLNYGEEWQDFYAVGRATSAIVDFNQYDYATNQQVYADVGLSRNDYYFFRSWGHADSRIYSSQRLDSILTNATKTAQQRDLFATLKSAVVFPAKNYILTVIGLSLFLLLLYRHQSRTLSLYVLLPFVICVGILVWQGRFPTRVSSAMIFLLPWTVLVLCGEMRKRIFIFVASSAAVIALAIPVYGQYVDLIKIANFRQTQNQDLHRLGGNLPPSPVTLVTLGASFPYEGLLPFESPSFLAGARIIWLCGMNQSPVQKKQLAENGIVDLVESLSNGKSSYLVLDAGVIRIFKQYIYEHYQKNVNFVPVFFGKTFTVYSVST